MSSRKAARNPRPNKAFVSMISLVSLGMLSAMAVAYISTASSNVLQAGSLVHVENARLTAESGMSFILNRMSGFQTTPGQSSSTMMSSLATALNTSLGSGNLGSHSVTCTNSIISVPRITIDSQGRGFDATLSLNGSLVRLRVTGHDGSTARTIGVDCNTSVVLSSVFNYGIATKSAISMTGNASIDDANYRLDASVLSSTYSNDQAVTLTGSCSIAGEVYLSNPDAYVSTTGNVSIGDDSRHPGDHVHTGIGAVTFPEIDPSPFIPFATNILDGNSNFTNTSYDNIRIKANTNPTFSGNVTIRGVVYIEVPNRVSFTGNCSVTGVIVTQDAGDNNRTNNTIRFTGNVSSTGVDQLPDLPQFHALRSLTGSFILAPGFGLSFTGNFGTVNGCMAADQFSFTGNSGGTIVGSIINYSDSTFTMTGNSGFKIQRPSSNSPPTGFVNPQRLIPNPDTYVEQ